MNPRLFKNLTRFDGLWNREPFGIQPGANPHHHATSSPDDIGKCIRHPVPYALPAQ